MFRRLLRFSPLYGLAFSTACAGPTREEVFPIDGELAELTIRTESGNIFAYASDGDPRIVALIGGNRTEVQHVVTDDAHQFSADCPPASLTCVVDFEVYPPPTTHMRLLAEGGDIVGEDITAAEIELESASGDVRLSGVEIDVVRVDAGSGNIALSGTTALAVLAESGSGNVSVDLRLRPDQVAAVSGSGDVSISVPSGTYDITATAGSGRSKLIGVEHDAEAPSVLVGDSGSGDVTIRGRP